MKKITAIGAFALALAAGSALAADLPTLKGPPPVYVPPAPVFSWTGFYGGANAGYAFGNNDTIRGVNFYTGNLGGTTPGVTGLWGFNQDLHGVVGGGQFGYNHQFSPWLVLGVEADIQAADLRSYNSTVTPVASGLNGLVDHFGSVQSTQLIDWYGSIRGRVGFMLPSMPNLMLFGTGGFAYGEVTHKFNYSDIYPSVASGVIIGNLSRVDTQTGWTAGGGVEWSPLSFPMASVKIEYLYTDLGSTSLVNPVLLNGSLINPFPISSASQTAQTRFHTVKAGLNLHFNPFATAPVLAKY